MAMTFPDISAPPAPARVFLLRELVSARRPACGRRTPHCLGEDGARWTAETGEDGLFSALSLACPPHSLSLDEANTQRPYGVYNLVAEREGYEAVHIEGVQIFDGETAIAELVMIPIGDDERAIGLNMQPEDTIIPPHPLWAGDGGSALFAPSPNARPAHSGGAHHPGKNHRSPGQACGQRAQRMVSFRDYIANVASSEIYPTWPEESLRANIHAQISIALNRIYTEWYKKQGLLI